MTAMYETIHSGLFITIEGIEGAGKSTVMQFMREYFTQKQIEPIVTREPGGTEIAEAIRHVLLNHHTEKMASDTELLLYFASRAQHIAQVIRPTLQSGKIVLCDRFTDSSYAYQCGGRGIDAARIEILENWVQGELRPDFVILLDLPVERGLERIKKRGELDRFEVEKIDFFKCVREYYLARAKRYPEHYRIINTDRPLSEIEKSLLQLLDDEILPYFRHPGKRASVYPGLRDDSVV